MTKETIDQLFSAMLEMGTGVSDLLFVPGKAPLVELDGRLQEFALDTPGGVLTEEHVRTLADQIINGDKRLSREFDLLGACDCSYAIEGVARFRCNIFRQNFRPAIVMRTLPSAIPSLAQLALPPVFQEIVKEKNGIVLITGQAGSGKSTSLAAVIDELNESQEIHIISLEDPIEYQHPHKKAVINQRELGKDFPSFPDGLRAALRQAPKVILVGEIRDRESMEIAMNASETGHLVFSTLHTINAGQTISRIIGMFPREEEQLLRQRLSETIRYVASQRLVSKIGGGRLLITEVMGSSLRTREAIVYGEGENKTFYEMMESGTTMGWHTFDQSLLNAFQNDLITEETAFLYSTDKNRVRRDLDLMKKRRGLSSEEEPSGLKLNITRPIEEIIQEQTGMLTPTGPVKARVYARG
jgi:twitching motility protein PilT